MDKPRVSTAIAEQIARSGGRSCNTREFAWLAADLLDARSRIAELEKDAERLDWVEVYVRQHAFGVTLIQRNDKGTLREAIDKAIAAQRQKEGE